MKIETTYDRLANSDSAFAAVMQVAGLSAADKMLMVRVRRAVQGDRDDIEQVRTDLAKKYTKIGHDRLIAEVEARAANITDPDKKAKALEAAKSIAEPTGVLPTELQAFQVEYTKHLEEKVTVEVPARIPFSKVASSPNVLPEHLFQLDWLFEDDISEKAEAKSPAQRKGSKKPGAGKDAKQECAQ